ncbi:MAG TPA: carbon starvation protein A [Tepidisphaeraceae bacterium]|jgi:carbon starvation protein|nr:carbon starvation protein A [Tepidisphaeraceae bacterium]
MSAMPVMILILCVLAIAYRYYSAFLAARVATLDDLRETPATRLNDGQNYHPTNKWVLFGHHFAAISGAGPLIGPVLAAQFGYLPGLLWIVIGVCLGGAVQDFLVLAASLRRNGRSLAQIAYHDIGKIAGTAATIAILFIVVIAIAGLGKVVVKALGGEEVKYPAGSRLVMTEGAKLQEIYSEAGGREHVNYGVPPGTSLRWNKGTQSMRISEPFVLSLDKSKVNKVNVDANNTFAVPPDAARLVPGSSWGTFTIACTIPIALLVGLWMYKIRPGKVVEASLIGAGLTLVATVLGGWVSHQPFGEIFNLRDTTVIWSMGIYGFIASVLPVWILLCPRDYLSSFLKIGTIALLVGGVILANPKMQAPSINHIFLNGGPTVPGHIFPFLFITIMCGAISGFHALVSSGTTPKMIKRETDARTIGYGAMLIEGLVGCVAMIAATTLPTNDYYAMNTDLAKVPAFHDKILQVSNTGGVEHVGDNIQQYESLTQESLRGRTGGAVTLAVGMAHIFDGAFRNIGAAAESTLNSMWKYWYHFAIMFEALFILTTIDTGTRIGRFLLQEVFGKISPALGKTDSIVGSIVSTGIIVVAWCYCISANSMDGIWPMFGIANQMLAVIALAIVSAYLANSGKARYLAVTVIPLLFVCTTTSTAAVQLLNKFILGFTTQWNSPTPDRTMMINSLVTSIAIVAMLTCTYIIILAAALRIWTTTSGARREEHGFEPIPITAK